MSVLIDDRCEVELSAALHGIELEIDSPNQVRGICFWRIHARGSDTFTASVLHHLQTLFTPKTLSFLMIHGPALHSCVMVSPSIPPPRMSLGIVT